MMRRPLIASLILAAAATTMGAQSSQPSNPTPAPPASKPVTLVGCVQVDAAKPEWFMLSDTKTGNTYHLTGTNVKAYVWRNVRIAGGLVPTANIAAQAGAIDQTKAAMASQGANPPGAGKVEPLEFNVTRVRRLAGSCAPKPDR
jgi:hypothetical protein